MTKEPDFTWVEFYSEFATKLLAYKDNRTELIAKIRRVYDKAGIKMPALERGDVVDIDPFTIFALFNRGITDTNRIAILKGTASEFGVFADVPNSFDGVPIVNNVDTCFYLFLEDGRGEEDIENLWSLFEVALRLAKNDTDENRKSFTVIYDIIVNKGRVKWKITIGLYWVRANFFMSLGWYHRYYLRSSEYVPEDFAVRMKHLLTAVTAENYLKIRDECKTLFASGLYVCKNFVEFAYCAVALRSKLVEAQKAKSKQANAIVDNDVETVRYWLYSPGSNGSKWEEYYDAGLMAIGWGDLGDLNLLASKADMQVKMQEVFGQDSNYTNSVHATWQFANEIKPGDIIFAKRGSKPGNTFILGRGVVTSEYMYDESVSDKFRHIRQVTWTDKGEWAYPLQGHSVVKTLTDITSYTEYVEKLKNLFIDDDTENDQNGAFKEHREIKPYTPEDFLSDVYMNEDEYHTIVGVLKNKKNIILQGAPGVGKTYAAKRLAYSVIGKKHIEQVTMVQFHQSYSYEDFIMGFRPSEQGFELRKGPFYEFCKKAEIDNENDYFFIIDEINRGNLSKIFGELFMLIESDKRGSQLRLLYSEENFSVPKNVHIIGMMNTADRSLALLDYALRRRFAFIEMKPSFDSDGFKQYRAELNDDTFDQLIGCVTQLNQAIRADESLGEGFCIGHSYFCNLTPDDLDDGALSRIVAYELIPLIKEYWFDEPAKVQSWIQNLQGVIK